MSHRRVKNLDYDDDDYYEEEGYDEAGGDGLSAEDEEQMRIGVQRVREGLGPDHKISDKDIQEALWHYYYDVTKSVSYLKNAQKPAQATPKQTKPESRFDQAAKVAAKQHTIQKEPYSLYPVPVPKKRRISNFFSDCPWLQVPPTRQGAIVSISSSRRETGLLGGSGKPSKLAALAAARRKKQAESSVPKENAPSHEPDRSITLLDKLGSKREAISPGVAIEEEKPVPIRHKPPTPNEAPSGPSALVPEPVSDVKEHESQPVLGVCNQDVGNVKADPSAFANALLGATSSRRLSQGSTPESSSSFAVSYFPLKSFAGPSPDDVVIAAQSKASMGPKGKTAATQGGKPSDGNKIADGVAALKINDLPKPKRRKVDVLAEHKKVSGKKSASFVVIGHVDHGKSTLMGRLLLDLNVITQRSLDKLQKEANTLKKSSFALAFIMDSNKDERERGITVDIATSHFSTDSTNYTILDAPGHQDFVPNMIAGAAQADFSILVVDASPNSFESGIRGQTHEHALIVRSMGASNIIVAVNKMDAAHWLQDRFNEIREQMTGFLTKVGFKPENLVFVPLSGLTGDNVSKRRDDADVKWYTGPTLVNALDSIAPTERAIEKPLRLEVFDISTDSQLYPVSISGRLTAGNMQVGDDVIAMPSGDTAIIQGITIEGNDVDWAVAGSIATVHLSGVDAEHLRQGDIICARDSPAQNVRTFQAKILAFEQVLPMFVEVHAGTMSREGQVKMPLVALLDERTGDVKKKRPKVLNGGEVGRVEVEFGDEKGAPVEKGRRVVLRYEGRTIAAGLVE
ncbi:hypothetical protein P152DRAFT_434558 [Eremomyces bilateralis CBS 781.70]|uniref:Elongation factor 1 alpha-like protein n=1 Tax=Eremomyces bilateralis CBS 781.70 TaxID=1392243 RepID=A0A6G1G5V7_9PEZI|nr:uncharacterized protein P152DRAFT_434558 [Eremomyces bilateralis CBS 781.70]KAF1813447.1 hypothetical protein P152DRAFT_434558 [Eremomyces bilateralis CBS 781.70]